MDAPTADEMEHAYRQANLWEALLRLPPSVQDGKTEAAILLLWSSAAHEPHYHDSLWDAVLNPDYRGPYPSPYNATSQ